MRKSVAAVGTSAFFALAPGGVAGLVPWLLTRWELREPLLGWTATRWAGGALLVAGGGVLVHSFARFVVEGAGTPAPVAPTERLVVGGMYRYVRNPMYVGVVTSIAGQALLLGQPVLLVYAGVVWLIVAAFVIGYEQPTLGRQFGSEYAEYRRAVPAWVPRLRPWSPRNP